MGKKILYSIAVFGIIGLGLYITSTFEYHEYYEECEKQSNTQGGIESCVDFMIEEAKMIYLKDSYTKSFEEKNFISRG